MNARSELLLAVYQQQERLGDLADLLRRGFRGPPMLRDVPIGGDEDALLPDGGTPTGIAYMVGRYDALCRLHAEGLVDLREAWERFRADVDELARDAGVTRAADAVDATAPAPASASKGGAA